jgi:4-oxalocrotonate tautomerase
VPLIRISLRAGKPAGYRRAIAENVYAALHETFNVPEKDFFATITEHDQDGFIYDPEYFNIARTDDLVLIQMTVSNTRTVEQKKALYRRITERLAKDPGLRPAGHLHQSVGSRQRKLVVRPGAGAICIVATVRPCRARLRSRSSPASR